MPDPPPGHRARPEEARCYNCGGSGHWAIACPEPTRETPAGLTAWRNANHAGRLNHRDQHGGSKKSKGPIITKYAPPQASGPNVNSYGPPQGYGQPPAPYSSPAPQYPPQYPPHSSSIPSYPAYPSYPPQPYPPVYGGRPPPAPPGPPPGVYNPPSHPHAPHAPHPSHPPHPPHPPHIPHIPHPPATPPSYPPPYSLPPGQPPQPYSSASPYGTTYPPFSYNSHSPPFPSSYPPPTAPPNFGASPGPRPGPSSGPPPRPPSGPPRSSAGSSSRPSSGPPRPSRQGKSPLTTSTLPHPSLPPKPPQSNRDLPEPIRDHRNKRKRERHNRNRDNRQKKTSSQPQPREQKGENVNRRHNPKPSETETLEPEASPQIKDEDPPEDSAVRETSEVPESTHKNPDDVTDRQSDSPRRSEGASDKKAESDDEDSQEPTVLEESESHPPDEVSKPLPADYSEEILLPRKWDSECIDSEFVKPDNLDEYIKPVHETDHWILIEFDPAFARDGKLPCGDPLPKLPFEDDQSDQVEASGVDQGNEHQKEHHSPVESPGGQPHKRQRSSSRSSVAQTSQRDDAMDETTRDPLEPRGRKRHRPLDSELQEVDLSDLIRQRSQDQKRPADRGKSRSRSVSSARSCISNASSGLDSLEAELLGRSVKSRSPDDGSNRRHPSANRIKKRQTKLDSAYSRRW